MDKRGKSSEDKGSFNGHGKGSKKAGARRLPRFKWWQGANAGVSRVAEMSGCQPAGKVVSERSTQRRDEHYFGKSDCGGATRWTRWTRRVERPLPEPSSGCRDGSWAISVAVNEVPRTSLVHLGLMGNPLRRASSPLAHQTRHSSSPGAALGNLQPPMTALFQNFGRWQVASHCLTFGMRMCRKDTRCVFLFETAYKEDIGF